MKALKLLQYATCIQVIIIVLAGLWILIFQPQLMTVFGSLCNSISVFLLPAIAASFAGKPLGQYMEDRKNIAAIKQNGGKNGN